MRERYTRRHIQLLNTLRSLWEQHVYWTRFFIISTAADLGDLEEVTARLLRNPGDFAAALTPFYGARLSSRFKNLLTQHLLIGADLVNAAKARDISKADAARRKWYANADDIAEFLAAVNPFWNETKWRNMLYDHLEMTEREATLRLGGKYAEDIRVFDEIEQEALAMADYMAEGMATQFRL